MKLNNSNRIAFIVIVIQIILIKHMEAQRSGIGLLQATMDSVWNNSGAFANDAEAYLKNLVSSTTETSTKVNSQKEGPEKSDSGSTDGEESDIFPNIIDKLTGSNTLPEMPWTSNTSSSPSTIAQNYLTDLLKPVEQSGANIVEEAVKTGVDRAVADISESFKVDVALVIAVLVIQIVLFVCGANLCFYVYKREAEMRSYVKQQVNVMKGTP